MVKNTYRTVIVLTDKLGGLEIRNTVYEVSANGQERLMSDGEMHTRLKELYGKSLSVSSAHTFTCMLQKISDDLGLDREDLSEKQNG